MNDKKIRSGTPVPTRSARWRGAAAAVGLGVLLAASAHAADYEVLATGLNNPRGIAFAPNGALYVTEVGNGGTGACQPSPAPPPGTLRCYGETGAVTRIRPHGGFVRVVSGLPSLGLPNGQGEGGPVDIAFHGMLGFVTMGWGGDPATRTNLGRKESLFGKLLVVTPWGSYRPIADVAGHEARSNPAGGNVDSNPYGVEALPGRRIVADAGANALIEVPWTGHTRTLAVVAPPQGSREAVPTSVTQGPDGALYVGLLTSFPFFAGGSSVLRVSSDGADVRPYVTGLTAVVDLAFDHGGALYILEVARGQQPPFPPPNPGLGVGRLKRKCPGRDTEVVIDGLEFPGGVAVGPDGAVYLTHRSTSATAGEVLRLRVPHC